MAESWGTVIVGAPQQLLEEFRARQHSDARDVVKALTDFAELDFSLVAENDCRIGPVDLGSGYARFHFDCSDWGSIAAVFVNQGNNLELYARAQDEYGTAVFLALSADGDRVRVSFDQGGDEWDQDDADEHLDRITSEIDRWRSILPENVKAAFPDFSDTDDLIFDGP